MGSARWSARRFIACCDSGIVPDVDLILSGIGTNAAGTALIPFSNQNQGVLISFPNFTNNLIGRYFARSGQSDLRKRCWDRRLFPG